MTPRALIIAGAILSGIVAAIVFNLPVSAVTPGDRDISCGSVWKPSDQDGIDGQFQESVTAALEGRHWQTTGYDGFRAACADARDSRSTWGYVLAGLCVAGLIGGAAVRRSGVTEQPTGVDRSTD
jgi:hypothetical protein